MGDPTETHSLLTVGEVVAGKYRIDRVIGRGGMAEVYAAYHELLQQTVALKVLLPGIADSADASARFLNEARSAARIRGEHVAAVMDVGKLPSGAAFMVLEYLEGRDLEAYAEEHAPLKPAEAVEFVLDALQAIAQAHALGIIHRDLKPSNLFLARRPDGSSIVKVLDFGISKISRSPGSVSIDAHSTASQAILGSPFYMAPEQARSARSVDPRADIWAIGVILHRFLTGALPFTGETLTDLLLAIVQDAPRPIRELRQELPEELEAIVLRCLRKNPAERFANVAELATALVPFAGKESAAAVVRISRTLAVKTPIQPTPAPAPQVPPQPPPASASSQPGPGTTSSWAEASAARNNKKAPTLSRGKLLAGGVVAAIGAAVIAVAVSRSANDSEAARSAGATSTTQEPASQPPASTANVVQAPIETSAAAAASEAPPAQPSASASSAPPPAPAKSAAPATPPARRSVAAPRPPASVKPGSNTAPPAPTYDLLNQRN